MENSEELIICRCQEVTEQEILDAIRDGAEPAWASARARPADVWCSGS